MKIRKPSRGDYAALNRNAGPVVMRIPADGGRATVRVPDEQRPRRKRGSR